jgi:hypothetical protein
MSSQDMHDLFQQFAPLVQNGLSIGELGKLLAEGVRHDLGRMCARLMVKHGTYASGTWSNRFQDWKRGIGRFANFKPNNNSSASEPKPTSTPRRRRSVESSTASLTESAQKRKRHHAYTLEEEERMARYIVARQPEDTKPNVKDWEGFSKLVSCLLLPSNALSAPSANLS